ncbi:MAG TPA: hypothetical protein VG125_14755 [Pirellulales bacterium]|nr:hypothetical protein [Pirellulales bacterium]
MRTMILAALAVLALGAVSSRAEAQVAYAYSSGAYPIYYYNRANVGYPNQGYYGGFTTPGFYGGTPVQSQPAPSYLSPIVQPAYGFAPTSGYVPPGYGYAVPAGSSLYGGSTYGGSSVYGGINRYTQYGYRRYGAGRTFGSSVPRIYSIYQPRPGGLFDR